jgi:hypothetical protein
LIRASRIGKNCLDGEVTVNWDAVSAVGQVLGSVAVLITLAYLAIQVRQARQQMARAALASRLEGTRELWLSQAMNPALAEAMAKHARAQPGLVHSRFAAEAIALGMTDVEVRLVHAYYWATWTHWKLTFEARDFLSPAELGEFESSVRINYGSGLGALWYSGMKPRLNAEMAGYVDGLLGVGSTAATPNPG